MTPFLAGSSRTEAPPPASRRGESDMDGATQKPVSADNEGRVLSGPSNHHMCVNCEKVFPDPAKLSRHIRARECGDRTKCALQEHEVA